MRGQLGFGLRVHVTAAGAVGLVAAQSAGDAQQAHRRSAGEVFEAAAVFLRTLCRSARHQLQRPRVVQRPAPQQPRVEALVAAVEVDHAAGLALGQCGGGGVDLRGHGYGLPLRHRPLAAVHGDAAFGQRAGAAEGMAPAQAGLVLPGVLARVETVGLARCVLRQGNAGGLVGVGVELLARQPQRVARGLVDRVQHQHHAVGALLPAQAHVAQRAFGAALRAEALDLHARKLRAHAESPVDRACQAHAPLLQAVAANVDREADAAFGGRSADERDHAARAAAVQRRERAAQHLDALRTGQVEVRHLALAVRAAGGNAVAVQTQPAHAEACTRAETTRVDLQVLCVVAAVAGHDAGHARQHLAQVDERAGGAQLFGRDHAHCIGRVQQAPLGATGGDDDRLDHWHRLGAGGAGREGSPNRSHGCHGCQHWFEPRQSQPRMRRGPKGPEAQRFRAALARRHEGWRTRRQGC